MDIVVGSPIIESPELGQQHVFRAVSLTVGRPVIGVDGVLLMIQYMVSPAEYIEAFRWYMLAGNIFKTGPPSQRAASHYPLLHKNPLTSLVNSAPPMRNCGENRCL